MGDTVSASLEGLERTLTQLRSGAKGAVIEWGFRAFPRLARSVLEVAAGGFRPVPIPFFFSTNVLEIDPAINDDLLELFGRAGQVLANRFVFFNSPQAFDHAINWDPPQTPSWRAELHACDYVLDLACTFRISGEEVYARHLRYLIANWIASNPPVSGTGWQSHVLARRVRNWILSADFARSDWERDVEFGNVVASSLALQGAYLLSQLDSLASSEARLDAARALLCLSRFFAGNKANEAREIALNLLLSELAAPRPDPRPHARVARAQALMEWNLLSVPDADSAFLRGELTAAMGELESMLLPEGSVPLLGPAARLGQDELADLAALAAVWIDSPVWKSLAGKFGILPYLYLGETGKSRFEGLDERMWAPKDFVNSGAEILRVAGKQNSALVISAYLPTSPSDHQDFTSYELVLDNHRVVADSGGFAPEESNYFSRARAHNILLVDGLDPRWHRAKDSATISLEFSPGWTRLRLADPGFGFLGLQHVRAWFRLENNTWLVLDWLNGQGVHSVTSLLHFYPTFELINGIDRVLVRSRARRLAVIPIGSSRPMASVSRGDHPQFPGWFSPEFGVKFPMAVLALTWRGTELPWLGGTLLTSDTDEPFRQLETLATEGRVRLEFSGNTYDLQIN